MVGFRCLYNQGSTHGINKLEDKKIHIFYIKKKITDLTNVFEDKKKNLKSCEGWERRNLKWNSKCKKNFTSQDQFSWLLFHISIISTS